MPKMSNPKNQFVFCDNVVGIVRCGEVLSSTSCLKKGFASTTCEYHFFPSTDEGCPGNILSA